MKDYTQPPPEHLDIDEDDITVRLWWPREPEPGERYLRIRGMSTKDWTWVEGDGTEHPYEPTGTNE